MKRLASLVIAAAVVMTATAASADTKLIIDGKDRGWRDRDVRVIDRGHYRDPKVVIGNGGVKVLPGRVVVQPRPVVVVKPRPTVRYVTPAPVVVVKPQPAYLKPWSAKWYQWCAERYRSFDAKTGTYTALNGRKQFCEAS